MINDMATVIELLQGTPAVTFHGTPEWALDYVLLTEAVWLPDEGQLRQRLHDILALHGEPMYDLFYADGEFTCRFEWKGEALAFQGATPVTRTARRCSSGGAVYRKRGRDSWLARIACPVLGRVHIAKRHRARDRLCRRMSSSR